MQKLTGGADVQVFGGAPVYPTFPGDRLLVDTQGNAVSHPTDDQASIIEGRGVLTSVGFSSINYASIELIDRQPTTTTNYLTQEFPLATLIPPTCIATPSFDFSEASGYPLRIFDYDTSDSVNAAVLIAVETVGPGQQPTRGTLQLLDGTSAQSNPLRLQMSMGRLREVLKSGFRYTPVPGFSGQLTLEVIFRNDDLPSGANAIWRTLNIGCNANNAPINVLPQPINTTQTTVLLSQANSNAISVKDVDAGTPPISWST